MTENESSRDFNLISPTAKSLLLLKGHTNIPFAKEAAELISLPEKYVPDFSNTDPEFWKRIVHFESRYWSINQLMEGLNITNMMELSSGFSFRGLQTVLQNELFYKDTDLPDLISIKKEIISSLLKNTGSPSGNLELLPLNALDEISFNKIAESFPPGPLLIINEGLLMYLDDQEKEKLCRIIFKILGQRGGYWITGDIYRKNAIQSPETKGDDNLNKILIEQRIEEKKFESFEAAEIFFRKQGFKIDKEAVSNYTKLSSLKYLVGSTTESELNEIRSNSKIQVTWRLRVSETSEPLPG